MGDITKHQPQRWSIMSDQYLGPFAPQLQIYVGDGVEVSGAVWSQVAAQFALAVGNTYVQRETLVDQASVTATSSTYAFMLN